MSAQSQQVDPVEAELLQFADAEFVLAERYTEWQIFAPTVESDLALANIAQDEFGHARLWYDLLQDEFDYEERDLIWERDPSEFAHSPLVELEFSEGDWADPIVRSYLYDTAEQLRLDALAESSYEPIADRVPKIQGEEEYHLEHAQSWLDRMAGSGESHERVQEALDSLFPYALTLFEAGPHEDEIVDSGIRTRSLADLREDWLDEVIPYLESLGLEVPDPEETTLPDIVNAEESHTDAWYDLYDSFTDTYREVEFTEPIRLRGDNG